jgi:hypothetical protein
MHLPVPEIGEKRISSSISCREEHMAVTMAAYFVHIADEMGRCAGRRLHELSKMIASLVPGYFEPALVDWSCLGNCHPKVAVEDVSQHIGADRPVEFSDDDRWYLGRCQWPLFSQITEVDSDYLIDLR